MGGNVELTIKYDDGGCEHYVMAEADANSALDDLFEDMGFWYLATNTGTAVINVNKVKSISTKHL
jgi:hypothetical protein